MTLLLLRFVCAAETATGLGLLADPSTVVQLLLGSEITGTGIVISRIGGIALIALGVACWPGGVSRGLQGMALYSSLAAAYMAAVGLTGSKTGLLWWPAFATHAVLGMLLVRALIKKQESRARRTSGAGSS